MSRILNRMAKACKLSFLAIAMCLSSGCSSMADDNVRASFQWGPVNQDLSGLPDAPDSKFTSESKAANLREELLAPVNRYAPSDKDWRFVRGTDKGPTIFGIRLRFDLSNGSSQLRLGAVRRGANNTYGPQLVFDFGQKH